MKKIVIMIMLLTVLCVGCGKDNESQTNTNNSTTAVEGESSNDTEGTETTDETMETEASKNERIYEPKFLADGQPINYIQSSLGGYDVVYDVPNYQIVESGRTKLYIRSGKLCIAVTRDKEGATGMALKDVFPTIERSFGMAMDSSLEGGYFYAGLEMAETEEVIINEVDCLHFTGEVAGTLTYGTTEKDKGYYAQGYAFVMDDTPFTIIGVVLDDGKEGQEYVDRFTEEVNHNLDELIKTLRDHYYK